MNKSRKGLAVIAALAFVIGAAAPALAVVQHPDTSPNTAANIGFAPTSLLPQDPAASGKATIVFADTALSGWRVDVGMKNVSAYLPNSLNWTRVGGVNSGAAGTCTSTGGNVQKPANGLCVNSKSLDALDQYNGSIALSCGPGCGPFLDGSYTAPGEFRTEFNNRQGGSSIKNENVVAHEFGHHLGIDHHLSQENANGRWYPGILGDFYDELYKYFNDPKYLSETDKHVPNIYEKERINNQWGYSTSP